MATIASILADPAQRALITARWLSAPLPPLFDQAEFDQLVIGQPQRPVERSFERSPEFPPVMTWSVMVPYAAGPGEVGGLAFLSSTGEILASGAWPTDWSTTKHGRSVDVTLTVSEGYPWP